MTQPTDFVYRATVVMYAPTAGPDYHWANVHEFTAPPGFLGDDQAVQSVSDAFMNFHRSLLNVAFGVDRVILGTWGPDLPWPPGFTVFNYRLQGTGPAWGAPLPLSIVAFVRKEVQRGRDGKTFLRGLLTVNSITGEEFIPDLRNIINNAGVTLLEALSAAGATLVLASGPITAIQTRAVSALVAVNARTLQYKTRRKTRLQVNAADTIQNLLRDGGITIDEIPTLIRSLRTLFPGREWPELPPPTP